MNDETRIWLKYSIENLESAKVLLKNNLYNSCLQNIQQSVEKALKAIWIENGLKIKKTHSIIELKNSLEEKAIYLHVSDEDCDFLDVIYLPSKYPINNVLPHFEPDKEICVKAISIAESVLDEVQKILKSS